MKIAAITIIAVLVAAALFANIAYADKEKELKGREEQGRLTVTNGIITVIATAQGKHPAFFWFANNQNNTIYEVKYKGIIEFIDTGQEIFQRKFSADPEKFIRSGEPGLKGINASRAGSDVTVSGTIRENKDRQTERLFNYLVQEGSTKVGINVSSSTKVQGEVRGEVAIKGTVMVSGQDLYIKAVSLATLENIRSQLTQMNPPFFEFNQGKWKFSGFQPIASGGKVIGYQFNFTMNDINSKPFQHLNDQIVIRNRIYNTTVKEGEFIVPTASMKTDIIIKSWKWSINSTAGQVLNFDLSKDKLALWLELTAFKGSKLDDAVDEKAKPSLTEIRSGQQRIDTRDNKTAKGEDEKKLEADKDQHKLTFVSENSVMGGYFNFSNTATVYSRGVSPAQGESVKVVGAYIGDQNKIKVYIVYPNFGAKSLEHDPSIGVTSTEPVEVQYAIDPVALNAGQQAPAPGAPALQPVQPGQRAAPSPALQPERPSPAQTAATSDSTMLIIGATVVIVVVGAVAVLAKRKK